MLRSHYLGFRGMIKSETTLPLPLTLKLKEISCYHLLQVRSRGYIAAAISNDCCKAVSFDKYTFRKLGTRTPSFCLQSNPTTAIGILVHTKWSLNTNILSDRIPSVQVRWKKWVNPYPPLVEDDLEEQFITGSGPGGQSINKTANCVRLKHKPTGVVVKCQATRSLHDNRKKARILLQEKLDWHFNGENSIKAIEERKASKKRSERKRKTNEKLEKLRALKEREGLT